MDKMGISVIIPTYNRAASIKTAIDSVLNQTFTNFELIIVDDGSSDDTESIINSITSPKITFLKTPENKGACAARNLGIRTAKYELITFLDSDDSWLEDYLLKHYEYYLKFTADPGNNFGLQFCSYYFRDGKNAIVMPQKKFNLDNEKSTMESITDGNFISTQTLLTKKSVLQSVGGFDEKLGAFQDWDLAMRIAKNHRVFHVPVPLVNVEFSADSITLNHPKRFLALNYLVEKYTASNLLSGKNLNKIQVLTLFYNISYKIKQRTTFNLFSVKANNPMFYKSYYALLKYFLFKLSLKTNNNI